jgi:hypothetical protein
MTGWTELVMTHMYPWPIGVLVAASAVSLLFGLFGTWALWRTRRLLTVVPEMQERLDTLSHSMSLLTDTTESCFKALSMQLQFMGSQNARAGQSGRPREPIAAEAVPNDAQSRKAKQRRVVGAARRGEPVANIAAREDVSETEVALRLHVNRESNGTGAKRYGSLHS